MNYTILLNMVVACTVFSAPTVMLVWGLEKMYSMLEERHRGNMKNED